jgi:hypothetical protein
VADNKIRAARNVLSGGPPRCVRDAKAFQFEILRLGQLSGGAVEEAISTATRGSIARTRISRRNAIRVLLTPSR